MDLKENQISVTCVAVDIARQCLKDLGLNNKVERKGQLWVIEFPTTDDADAFLEIFLDY